MVTGLAVTALGCSSPYLTNRVRDAADVATVSCGYGIGVRARVSAIGTGLFANRDLVGLRGGHLGMLREPGGAFLSDVDLVVYRMEVFFPQSETADARHKDFVAVGIGPWTKGGEFELFRHSHATPQFYSQIEIAAGLGPSIRLGVNPGELVDFFVGLAGVDLFGDDIEEPCTE